MASGDTGNVVPGNRLRVRVPCPPLGCDLERARETTLVAVMASPELDSTSAQVKPESLDQPCRSDYCKADR